MSVKVHYVTHGSPEWLDLRAMGTWNASEAPVMMGDHPKMKRTELMHAQVTMTPKQFSSYVVEVVFERGHETEAKARAIMSDRLGDELFRVTVTNTNEQEGYTLLCSLDGALIPDLNVGFEHKQWSEELVAYLEEHGEPPPYIYWQLEHQLATVPSMEKILLVISNGTPEKMVVFEYRAVPGRRQRLIAGWKQFQQDKAAYKPVFKEEAKVGVRPADLPVPTLEVAGELATHGNLQEFDSLFRQMVSSINTDLKTDQDFADATAAVKYLDDLRGRLAMSKKLALNKVQSLDEAFKVIDSLDELARVTAKNLDSQIKTRKESRKTDIANEAARQIKDANQAAAAEFSAMGVVWERQYKTSFSAYELMKGMRSFDQMAAKVDAEVTKIKLDIGQARDKVRGNIAMLQQSWKGVEFLFSDINDLVSQDPGILKMTIAHRIREHQDRLRETEAARINAHKQALAKLEAPLGADADMPIEMLRVTRCSVNAIDPAKLEEFAGEAAKKKAEALAHLDSLIAGIEAKEAEEAAAKAREEQESIRRQLEANMANAALSVKTLIDAADTEAPVDVAAGFVNIDMEQGRTFDMVVDDDTPLHADLDDAGFGPSGVTHHEPVRQAEPEPAMDRPNNNDIIKHLMIYYAEDRDTVVGWIKDMAKTL